MYDKIICAPESLFFLFILYYRLYIGLKKGKNVILNLFVIHQLHKIFLKSHGRTHTILLSILCVNFVLVLVIALVKLTRTKQILRRK